MKQINNYNNNIKNSAGFGSLLILFGLYFLARMLMTGAYNVSIYNLVTLVLFIVTIFTFVYFEKSPINTAIFISLLYVFQNTIIGLGLNFSKSEVITQYNSIQTIIALSSLYGILVFAIIWLDSPNKIVGNYEKIGFVMLITTIIYMFIGEFNFVVSLGYARNLFLFIMFPLIGRMIVKHVRDIKIFLNYIFTISVFVALFGFVEMLFFTNDIWYSILHLDIVLNAKGMIVRNFSNLPSLFYTLLFEYKFRRMASFFMEPVNLSYFFAVPLILSFVLKKRILFVVFSLALILTFGKGGWLVTFIGICSILLLKLKEFQRKDGFTKLFLITLVLFVVLAYLYFKISPGTALPHLWGLMAIEQSLLNTPFGHGLGSGGNFAAIDFEGNWMNLLNTGAESGVSALAYKMGIIGTSLYIFFILSLGSTLFKIYLEQKNEEIGRIALACCGMLLGILFGSIFQENPLGPQTNHLALLLSGIVIGYSNFIKKSL
ncbi:hypothetical protein P4571_15275 [Niallia alba]|uniref:hypothetical protein n=1 Tax=Niallia alba TaxID=2729105 RepID=UPI002E224F08|nr:hypothetical protein [Niallia alba]